MVLLDAALAFALTLAALATVVTIVMEILLRSLGLRKEDQVKLIMKLYDEELKPRLPKEVETAELRWKVVRKVLENPFAGTAMASSADQQSYRLRQGKPVYDRVTLEHLLRRVLEVDEVKQAYLSVQAESKRLLTDLSRKYDEYRSALGASFRTRAQLWSLYAGVVLALLLNVDGVRLLQWYMNSPAATQQVIAQSDEILASLERAEAALEAARGPEDATLEQLERAVERMEAQGEILAGLDLPIGVAYFPHCRVPWLVRNVSDGTGPAEARCGETYDWKSGAAATDLLTWLIKAVFTGLLIGLGAPFWYDVARRLAQVRRAFGGAGSSEQRHSGEDGGRKADDRGALIDKVHDEALQPDKPVFG